MTSPEDTAAIGAAGAASGAAASAGITGAVTGLAAHAAALQSILTDLATITLSQLVALFRQYADAPNFEQVLRQAFPEIVLPHATAAATVTAQWYDELDPTSSFTASPVVDLPTQRIDKTIGWSLYAPTEKRVTEDLIPREPVTVRMPVPADVTLSRLAGSTKRMVFDASRSTVAANAGQQGIRWARYASANACAFCRVMATKSDSKTLYKSEQSAMYVVGRAGKPRGSRQIGEKWHDHCRCVAVAVPEGQTYTPPDYVDQWGQDYKAAWNAVPDGTPYKKVLPMVLKHMRENTDAR